MATMDQFKSALTLLNGAGVDYSILVEEDKFTLMKSGYPEITNVTEARLLSYIETLGTHLVNIHQPDGANIVAPQIPTLEDELEQFTITYPNAIESSHGIITKILGDSIQVAMFSELLTGDFYFSALVRGNSNDKIAIGLSTKNNTPVNTTWDHHVVTQFNKDVKYYTKTTVQENLGSISGELALPVGVKREGTTVTFNFGIYFKTIETYGEPFYLCIDMLSQDVVIQNMLMA